MIKLLAGAAGALLLGIAPAGAAQTPLSLASYSVSARADVIAVQIVDPGAPLFPNGEITYATPGTAQAVVDSLGESTAFASSPYPGDAIAGLPSLFNGLGATSGAPPLPPYPFLVTSSYPSTPVDVQTQGPYSLAASSSPSTADADARTGLATANPAVVSLTAGVSARFDAATGALTAIADDATDGFSIGPLLSIGRVAAHAELVTVAGKEPVASTSFALDALSIGGIRVGFNATGLQIGPEAVLGVTPSVLSGVLSAAGITLAYLPAVRSPTQIESAGLSVTIAGTIPSQGRVTTTLIIGRVRVATPYSLGAGSPPPPMLPGSTSGGFTHPLAGPLPSTLGSQPTASIPVIPGPPGASSGLPAEPAPVALAARVAHGTGRFFLILVVAGIVLLAMVVLGERRRAHAPTPSVLRLPPR